MSNIQNNKLDRRHELNRQLHASFLEGDEMALQELIRQNKGLASIVTRKYKWVLKLYRDIELVDLDQAALIGIWQAALDWDPDRGELAGLAMMHASNEIRRMIWKRQSCRNDGVLEAEVSANKPLSGTDDLKLEDMLKDSGELPDSIVEGMERCHEFFQKLDELNPIPGDMKALKDFVYSDWPPKDPKTFRRIKQLIQGNSRTRGWVRDWMDWNTTFIRSQAFDRGHQRGVSDTGYSDPTASAVVNRERLENRLKRLLGDLQ